MAGRIEFAVVDVETTGFSPAKHDRVIEIAIVRMDDGGRVIDEYVTLVNPRRDVGPTNLHGISAGDVNSAPSFADVAGDVAARLAGAVVVAHNARFDVAFVKHEMRRAGVAIPEFPYLCTMQIAGAADPDIPSRKLRDLCEYFGIDHPDGHSAMHDARATGALLTACIPRVCDSAPPSMDDWGALGIEGSWIAKESWPVVASSGRALRREEMSSRRAAEPCYIATLVAQLPTALDVTPQVGAYLAVLDRALEDRRVSEREAEDLVAVAVELGIVREQAAAAHERYLAELTRVAMADGVVTKTERTDLNQVRRLLGVSQARHSLMFAESPPAEREVSHAPLAALATAKDVEGKSVCFTGQLACRVGGEPVTRAQAEGIAAKMGMLVKPGVTKGLDFLVTADPDSMSGKAEKAKKYGVRILSEMVFWKLVGVDTN